MIADGQAGRVAELPYLWRKVAATRAGFPSAGLHTLRHSAASTMLSHGVPLRVVAEILGHSSIAITGEVYGTSPPTSPAKPSPPSAAPRSKRWSRKVVNPARTTVRAAPGLPETAPELQLPLPG